MQQSIPSVKERLKTKAQVLITTLIWAGGLLLAGSDGPLMPYINGVGVLAFLGATFVLGRILPRLEPAGSTAPNVRQKTNATKPCFRPNRRTPAAVPGVGTGLANSFSSSLQPRYARELGVI